MRPAELHSASTQAGKRTECPLGAQAAGLCSLPERTRIAIWIVSQVAIQKSKAMKVTKNIGMLLLAVYLIIDGLLGFGINFGPAIFLLYLVALAAGIFILIGK